MAEEKVEYIDGGWFEEDGTEYRLRADGKTYDVFPPAKKSKAKKAKKSKK